MINVVDNSSKQSRKLFAFKKLMLTTNYLQMNLGVYSTKQIRYRNVKKL